MKCLLLLTTFYYLFDSCYSKYSPNADLLKTRLRPAKQSPVLTPNLDRKLYQFYKTMPSTRIIFPTEAWI